MNKLNIYQYLLPIVFLSLLMGSFTTQQAQAQCSTVAESDSLVLVDFYNATNGVNWANNSGWLAAPVEQWFGISLTSDGCNVEEIEMNFNQLEGALIDLQLPQLKKLDVSQNMLSGSIIDFSNLPILTELNLGNNELSGTITDFSNLPNLKWLSLEYNNLSGAIPDFSNLPNLEVLHLFVNTLSDAIPNFSNLPNLIELRLSDNNLSGAIPDFSNLQNLTRIDFHQNNLSGSIPNFSNLPNLIELRLNNNALTGSISDFSNMPNLVRLMLFDNSLSGSIPDFSNLPNLEWLWLGRNNLSGTIPDFSSMPNLEWLYLDKNDLSGTIPDFSNLPNLGWLYLDDNDLSGKLPNFSNLPSLETLQVCPNNLQGGVPNFMFCPLLDLEAVDFSCVQSAQVTGYVFYDENGNCIKDENEKGIPNVFVYTDDEQFLTLTDEDGFYVLKTDIGSYTFTNYWQSDIWSLTCPTTPYSATFTSLTDSIGNLNYAYEPIVDCPQLNVNIGTPLLVRCFENIYTINYCNIGTVTAEDAFIELYFPDVIIPQSSSIPFVQEDDYLIFDIGDVGVLECGSFTLLDSISCAATLRSTVCVDAYAFPNDPCVSNPSWEGEDLQVKGECVGDSVRFTITNTGMDMSSPRPYRLYIDNILVATETYQLESGGSLVLSYEATGATYRLTVKQSLVHPSITTITEVVEGCGNIPFSFGLVNSQWDGDDNPLFDFDCQEIVGSYDPNDKIVFPSGVLEENRIPDFVDLNYRIRFQNTGNAVAYRVIIIDTIDVEQLYLPSLEVTAFSHDYNLVVEDSNVIFFTFDQILLPDSASNQAASQGFISYSLKQQADNKYDDLITNKAAIYFDYNVPIITNEVFNTVGLSEPDTIHTYTTPTPIYDLDMLVANVNYDRKQLSIQINQIQAGEQFSLQLFNLLGQEVDFIPNLSIPLHQKQLPQVQAGVYLYHIQSTKGRVAKGKVMIR